MMRLFLLILLLNCISPVLAQNIYKWVDDNGEVHYSQTLPPERVESEHDRLTGEGLVAERVQRAPSQQERLELAERLSRERDSAEQERIRKQQERLFLASFPAQEDVRRSFESRAETIETEQAAVLTLVEQTRVRFNEQLVEAAALERVGKKVPEHLVEGLAALRVRLEDLAARRREIEQRLFELDQEMVEQLERHSRLTGSG
ncbi:MAG: DUF4124 domain-containing protein [Wenzhouxiangellaceae bacterium]|nr:DUF4124 domain-containing protein [Wenzhouxiangellaceae bacterium]